MRGLVVREVRERQTPVVCTWGGKGSVSHACVYVEMLENKRQCKQMWCMQGEWREVSHVYSPVEGGTTSHLESVRRGNKQKYSNPPQPREKNAEASSNRKCGSGEENLCRVDREVEERERGLRLKRENHLGEQRT